MRIRIRIYFALFLVLLIVPSLLSACKGRTVLDGDKSKQVTGAVVAPGKAGSVKSIDTVESAKTVQSTDVQPAKGLIGCSISLSQMAFVWFTNVRGEKIDYFPSSYPPPPSLEKEAALKYVVELLLAGPKDGHTTQIPAGTKLLGIGVNADHSLVINLSSHFVQGGGRDGFEARMEQLRRTAEGAVGEQAVYLDIEGKRLEVTGEGLEVQQPINEKAYIDEGGGGEAGSKPPN